MALWITQRYRHDRLIYNRDTKLITVGKGPTSKYLELMKMSNPYVHRAQGMPSTSDGLLEERYN